MWGKARKATAHCKMESYNNLQESFQSIANNSSKAKLDDDNLQKVINGSYRVVVL